MTIPASGTQVSTCIQASRSLRQTPSVKGWMLGPQRRPHCMQGADVPICLWGYTGDQEASP